MVDISIGNAAESLIESKADIIFHLAAIVSGEAKDDFEKGYRVNVDRTRNLFEAIRQIGDGYCPRVVFASSVAVYGGKYPDIVGEPLWDLKPYFLPAIRLQIYSLHQNLQLIF